MAGYRLAALILGGVSGLVGAGHLAAWLAGLMQQEGLSAITMKTNTALCLLLLGTALVLVVRVPVRPVRCWVARGCAAVATLIGAATFSQHVIGWDLGIDQVLAQEPPGAMGMVSPNRMGPPASVAVPLAGVALLLLSRRRRAAPRAAQGLALGVCLIGLLATIGYLYGALPLYGLARLTGIAWPTALTLLGLGLGLLCARPDEGLMARVTAADAGGTLIRRLLLPMALLPVGLGGLHLLGERLGWFDAGMGAAVLVLPFIVVFSALVYFAGRRVSESGAVLRESEERLNQAARVADLGIFEHDHRSDAVYCSPTLRRIWGWGPEEAVTLAGILDRVPAEDRQRLAAAIQRAHDPAGNGAYEAEHRIVRPDGGVRWISVRSQTFFEGEGAARRAARTVGAMLDITERRQAEEALRQSELFHRQALESIPGMVFTTRPDGYCDYQSQQWVEFTGVPMSEHLGDGWNKLLHPEDRPRAYAAWRAAVEGRAPYDLEYRVRRHDGEYRWFKVRGRPIRDAEGRIVRWFGVSLDIEELKRAEEELAAAKVSAERARFVAEQASQAKDQFLAVLSHELRTPLMPVLAVVSEMQQHEGWDPDMQENLETIRRNVELEARLIDDLLDVTRIARGKVALHKQSVELCTILKQAIEVCRPDIEARRLEFGVDVKDGPYLVHADPARLQQVFWNLLKNAIKFTPEGGWVGIRCRRDGAGHVIAEVNDSGVGIAAEAMARLFKPFEQGERGMTRQFGGLGLGLTISKAMAELHGGSIEARSDGVGKGASFVVRLPIAEPQAAAATTAEAPPAHRAQRATGTRKLKILLVEDHGDTARIMARLLRGQGHEVLAAADVATAVKLASDGEPGGFDLLLSDLGLPDGSGLDVMRTLRARGMKVPGIAISGYGQEQDVQQSREAGFAAHLTKPVNVQQLVQAIAAVTGG